MASHSVKMRSEVEPARVELDDTHEDVKFPEDTLDPMVVEVENGGYDGDVDHAYLNSSKFTKFYRSMFLQMVLFAGSVTSLPYTA
jgi:hypothetical protein